MKYAIVDIGSNTIRLTVYQTDKNQFRTLFTSKQMAGLANYKTNGFLNKEGIMLTCSILNQFYSILSQFEIDQIAIFATASLRNIENTTEVINEIFQKTGYQVDVISGHNEALYDFYGVTYKLHLDRGIIFDIGGGSTELIVFDKKEPCIAESIGIGSLNLYNEYVKKLQPKSTEICGIYKRAQNELHNLISGRLNLADLKNEALCAVGGSARAVLKLVNFYYHFDKDNQQIDYCKLKGLLNLYEDDSTIFTSLVLKICPDRIHTIIPGMLIMKAIIKQSQSKTITVSNFGVREGYLIKNFLSIEASDKQYA